MFEGLVEISYCHRRNPRHEDEEEEDRRDGITGLPNRVIRMARAGRGRLLTLNPPSVVSNPGGGFRDSLPLNH